jgi:hypothetical protein
MVADIGFRRTFRSTDDRPAASNGDSGMRIQVVLSATAPAAR